MDINKKVKEIQKKPEHERVKYVWIMVAISMIFVIILWIISLKENFSSYSASDTVKADQINLQGVITE